MDNTYIPDKFKSDKGKGKKKYANKRTNFRKQCGKILKLKKTD